ncbi:hypothetical protein [Streptomyces dysideae]|uniref:Uncharacterized protein n=1 Tax=Streptomyces dysideae TaxID=909626 RepID=A0A124IEX8_9ACTN|nr:hypothetical protein [Streptomyces dysideae]KUO19700.1 hypothetical protein AQJ91_17915 [Streptomyces dysideae]
MSSFTTHRRRVHDTTLPPRARHANLRSCLVAFAPYGFRATYHHLCVSAGIPRNPEHAPDALVRAVEELTAARRHWLTDERAYAAQRRVDKARGRRQPPSDASWRRWQRQWGNIAYCPDPAFHPAEPLPVVVERVLRTSVPPGCRACGRQGETVGWGDGYYWYRLCAGCGVAQGRERAGDVELAARRAGEWKDVWRLRADYGQRASRDGSDGRP